MRFPDCDFPLVYLISDGTIIEKDFDKCLTRFFELVLAAVEAKISLIQIREKQLSAKKVFELTRRAAQITQNSQTLLLVNDRADIALAANADGVQLTANSLLVSTVRQSFPKNFVISVSAHSLSEATTAATNNADLATFSPIFPSPSKAKYNLPPQGTETLREVCAAVRKGFPVIALGGIDETNLRPVLEAGASGIAAIRLLNDAENLLNIVKLIRNG